MSIGRTLDRLTCSAGRSIRGNFDGAALAGSSSQSPLIIALFPPNSPQPVQPNVGRSGRQKKFTKLLD